MLSRGISMCSVLLLALTLADAGRGLRARRSIGRRSPPAEGHHRTVSSGTETVRPAATTRSASAFHGRRRREQPSGVGGCGDDDVQRRLQFAAQCGPDVGKRSILRGRQRDVDRHRKLELRKGSGEHVLRQRLVTQEASHAARRAGDVRLQVALSTPQRGRKA